MVVPVASFLLELLVVLLLVLLLQEVLEVLVDFFLGLQVLVAPLLVVFLPSCPLDLLLLDCLCHHHRGANVLVQIQFYA